MRGKAFVILPDFLNGISNSALNEAIENIINEFCEHNAVTWDFEGNYKIKNKYFYDYCTVNPNHDADFDDIQQIIDDGRIPYVLVYPILDDNGLKYLFSENDLTVDEEEHKKLCEEQFKIHKDAFGVWLSFHS
jgi:hypothetical protein